MRDAIPLKKGLASGLCFALAILAGSLVGESWDIPPIVPAITASLVLAGLEWLSRQNSPHADVAPSWNLAVQWSVAFATGAVLLMALAALKPAVIGTFVCEPLVPWGASIAIYGAFFSAWMTTAMKQSRSGARLQPALRLMLLWIAPFYGFFHAPWFLAQSVAVSCPNRPFAQLGVAAIAMAVSAYGGGRLATWMYSPSSS